MRYEVRLAASAEQDLRALRAFHRAKVRDALERHLRYRPMRVSKSRIKRLRGLARPQYRLRVDDIRVFYDVAESTVEVLAIIPKPLAESWLREKGIPHEEGGSREG
jgi:mRNA-degrading endonuclease RelE of RelBE toxin-antitoxin system